MNKLFAIGTGVLLLLLGCHGTVSEKLVEEFQSENDSFSRKLEVQSAEQSALRAQLVSLRDTAAAKLAAEQTDSLRQVQWKQVDERLFEWRAQGMRQVADFQTKIIENYSWIVNLQENRMSTALSRRAWEERKTHLEISLRRIIEITRKGRELEAELNEWVRYPLGKPDTGN